MTQAPKQGQTHFGYQWVDESEKSQKVGNIFDTVADRYDIMNDLMSMGVHRLWKRLTVAMSGIRPGQRVLDLAGGTGDISRLIAGRLQGRGELWLTDINYAMLHRGRDRLLDEGVAVHVAQCDAENLPFPENYFNAATLAFGLRNMTHLDKALQSIHRVMAPGGQLLVLEFSQVTMAPLRKLYDWYSMNILPAMGKAVTGSADSYRYLAESIRMHPDQATLKGLFEQAGFENCDYHNFTAGVVAVHRGYKL